MSARPTASTTGALAVGTNAVVSGKTTLNSVQVVTDGTNAATVTIYDNDNLASGKVLSKVVIVGANLFGGVDFSCALRAEIGLTVVVSGTAAVAYVSFGSA